jgi:hypothetical protein
MQLRVLSLRECYGGAGCSNQNRCGDHRRRHNQHLKEKHGHQKPRLGACPGQSLTELAHLFRDVGSHLPNRIGSHLPNRALIA